MPSHQLQMYDHASHLDKLLSSDLPAEDAIAQTGQIVRDAVAVVQSALAEKIPVHVPALLLSASVEFDIAYRPGGNQTPQLTRICENDKRLKSNLWYQPVLYAKNSAFNSVLPILIVTPQTQKRLPANPSLSYDETRCSCTSPV